jgi:hypothetical protein
MTLDELYAKERYLENTRRTFLAEIDEQLAQVRAEIEKVEAITAELKHRAYLAKLDGEEPDQSV